MSGLTESTAAPSGLDPDPVAVPSAASGNWKPPLRTIDAAEDRVWRRGLWAIGVITPWVFFALLLGVFVGIIGAKSLARMPVVAFAFGIGIVKFGMRWRRRLSSP